MANIRQKQNHPYNRKENKPASFFHCSLPKSPEVQLCVCVIARKRVCPPVPDAVSSPPSLQLRWACGASDPLSPTLFLRLSLLRRSHSWLWMDCAYLHSSRRLWTLQVCAADRAPVFVRLSRLCARVCLRDYLGFCAIFSSTLQMKMWRRNVEERRACSPRDGCDFVVVRCPSLLLSD